MNRKHKDSRKKKVTDPSYDEDDDNDEDDDEEDELQDDSNSEIDLTECVPDREGICTFCYVCLCTARKSLCATRTDAAKQLILMVA
jgi:hypothetical protein